MSNEKQTTTAPSVEPAEEQETSKKSFYFKNSRYSALKLLVRGGEDQAKMVGIKESARFVPYYDVFKGDVIKIGYLKTNSKAIAKMARADNSCEEIEEKEYNLALEGDDKHKALRRAPFYLA